MQHYSEDFQMPQGNASCCLFCCSDLRSKVSELELRLQAHEKDMKNQINKFSEIQSQLEMAKKDVAEKDKLLNKSRDELTKATGQYEQSVSKVRKILHLHFVKLINFCNDIMDTVAPET